VNPKVVPLLFLALSPTAVLAQDPPPAQDPGQAFVEHFDTNKDGRVSKAEFLKPAEAQFAEMDRNGDGFVSLDEARAAAEARRRQIEQMRQQRGQQRR